MKKFIFTLTLLMLTIFSFAQAVEVAPARKREEPVGIRPMNWKQKNGDFKAQSLDVSTSSEKVSVLWLRDGLSTNYTALAVPMFQVTGLGNRVSLVALGAYDSNFTKTNIWTGTGVSVSLLEHAGWSLKAFAGWKGFNLGNNFKSAQGKEAFVYGVGFSIPIR